MYRALTAELQIHQSPKKNVSSWDQGTEFFGFWKLSEFVNSQAKTHHCFSIVVFSGHVDYTSHGCMTVNLFGAYNIYNITFGNCNKDNSIDCHGLLPLSGNKNLKINKKTRFPMEKNQLYIYIYIIYIQATIWELSSTTLDYMEAIPGIPFVIPPNLSVPIWMHGIFRKKKNSHPSSFTEPFENDSRLTTIEIYWFSTQMNHF